MGTKKIISILLLFISCLFACKSPESLEESEPLRISRLEITVDRVPILVTWDENKKLWNIRPVFTVKETNGGKLWFGNARIHFGWNDRWRSGETDSFSLRGAIGPYEEEDFNVEIEVKDDTYDYIAVIITGLDDASNNDVEFREFFTLRYIL